MRLVTADTETYWSATHTLSKMSPTEYATHPDTEIISVAIKVGDNPTYVLFGEENIRRHVQAMDWSDTLLVFHNANFDAMLWAWRLGVKPKLWGCTVSMARSRYSKTGASVGGKFMTGVSLKKLAVELGVGHKLDLEATNTKGKHLCDFTPEELRAMEVYNEVDTDLCWAIFKKLYPSFPKQEMLLIDMTTRMLVEPQFEIDYATVNHALEAVQAEKAKGLRDLYDMLYDKTEQVVRALEGGPPPEEYVRSVMASAAKFGEVLKARGVEVPMKPSPTNPHRQVPALAKTDEAFTTLTEHEDPVVAAAARVRLDVKSTLLETRLKAFLAAADACGGKLPMPLKYAGADTTGRWSGEQYNPQNLPRINPDKPKASDALRMALRAPKGHKVIAADLSGIELRVNMFLWQVPYAMELFKASPDKADLYTYFAAHDLYHIAEAAIEKWQRQVGKVSHLGLGFGAGGATFQQVARLMGGITLTLEEATEIVDTYRAAHPEIVAGWRRFQTCLQDIAQGTEVAIDPWGMCVTEHQAIRLPSGRKIHYPALERVRVDGKSEWYYGEGRSRSKIYAGKGVENIVQALARDVVAEHAVRAYKQVYKQTGLRPALTVHDELVYVVPASEAEGVLAEVQSIMRSGVSWWPELITWSAGAIGDTYGECK